MAKLPRTGDASAPDSGAGSDAPDESRYPRRTARRKLTRAKIIVAAARLFNKFGYGATTMQNIADAADIHVTTLFMHFNSKQDLAICLATVTSDDLRERALAAKGKVGFFDFFRAEMKSTAIAATNKSHPAVRILGALRNNRELAFAWLEYDGAQRDIFSDFIAHDFKLDRESSLLPDLVASLMLSGAFLAHQKWAAAPTKVNLMREVEAATAIAEIAARQMLAKGGAKQT